jgi:hypothetical protein
MKIGMLRLQEMKLGSFRLQPMKLGTLRLHRRTVKGLYFAVGSFTILAVGAALFFLMGLLLMPEAREMPWR